MYMLYLCWSG